MEANNNHASYAANVGSFVQSVTPEVVSLVLQDPFHTEAALSRLAMRNAALDPATISEAIQTVMPAALEIVLEGLRAAIGPMFSTTEEDIEYIKDHISVFYQRKMLPQQISANAN